MDLITTHANADFDALASMVAAKKLYPEARMMLPGSQEAGVRRILSLTKDVIRIETERECSLEGIDRVILVETRLAARIGKAALLLSRKGIKIFVYDHHPRTQGDIKADRDVYGQVGATATILVDEIKKKNIVLDPFEATVIALGIYQDTGSLVFPTTTRKDVEAVSFLLEQGANLGMVFAYLKDQLDEGQMRILSKLLVSTRHHTIKGTDIAIAVCDAKGFEGELAFLAHKLMEVEGYNVIFVLAQTKTAVVIIARSHLPNVDVAKIAQAFGGGGHPTAASAVIKGANIDEIQRQLPKALNRYIKYGACARDFMIKPPVVVGQNKTVESVARQLDKADLAAALIVKKAVPLGVISSARCRDLINKGLGYAKVLRHMQPDVISIKPDTTLSEITQIFFNKKFDILPIVENAKIAGVISRTDTLKATYKSFAPKIKSIYSDIIRRRRHIPGRVFLAREMQKKLPGHTFRLLRALGELADRDNEKIFAVGGFVRDLMLGVKNFDVDVVTEANAIDFAKKTADKLKATLVTHARFGTASIFMPDSSDRKGFIRVDLATARREFYERPAALPTVKFATIKEDLFRRDFTINAMAISLNKPNFGQLVDFFGGQRDLRDKKIRVLHDLSFVDDPTRIFRAVRFQQRLGFEIEPHTEGLIRHAITLDMFAKTQRQRLRDEIILILKEPNPLKAVLRMSELHELKFIHPRLKVAARTVKLFKAAGTVCRWFSQSHLTKRKIDEWLIYFLALIDCLPYKDAEKICRDFVFTKGDEKRILHFKKNSVKLIKSLNGPRGVSPSRIYRMLEPLPYEVILMCMVKSRTGRVRQRIGLFLQKYNGVKLYINGDDLHKLGVAPGPHFKKIMGRILYAKLDGKICNSKQDEIEYARELI